MTISSNISETRYFVPSFEKSSHYLSISYFLEAINDVEKRKIKKSFISGLQSKMQKKVKKTQPYSFPEYFCCSLFGKYFNCFPTDFLFCIINSFEVKKIFLKLNSSLSFILQG